MAPAVRMPEESGTAAVVPPPAAPPEPKKVKSLAEIKAVMKEVQIRSPPIDLEWEVPRTEENPAGMITFHIETRFPKDPWLLGVRYMTTIQDKLRMEEPNEKKEMVRKHPLADVVELARECVVEPTWLHNEAAVKDFKEIIPPLVFAEFRRKLMLNAGLDGDFFDDYQRLTIPRSLRQSGSESASASDSRPGPVTAKEPTNSSLPPSTTTGDAEKSVVSVSPTTSGS